MPIVLVPAEVEFTGQEYHENPRNWGVLLHLGSVSLWLLNDGQFILDMTKLRRKPGTYLCCYYSLVDGWKARIVNLNKGEEPISLIHYPEKAEAPLPCTG